MEPTSTHADLRRDLADQKGGRLPCRRYGRDATGTAEAETVGGRVDHRLRKGATPSRLARPRRPLASCRYSMPYVPAGATPRVPPNSPGIPFMVVPSPAKLTELMLFGLLGVARILPVRTVVVTGAVWPGSRGL